MAARRAVFPDGQPSTEGLFARFAATDALGLLDDTYYKGCGTAKSTSLWELARAVLEDAGCRGSMRRRNPGCCGRG